MQMSKSYCFREFALGLAHHGIVRHLNRPLAKLIFEAKQIQCNNWKSCRLHHLRTSQRNMFEPFLRNRKGYPHMKSLIAAASLPFTGKEGGGGGWLFGLRFVQMVNKTSWMGNFVGDHHVPFVQFTVMYREAWTSLTLGAGPGTGRKKVNGTQFSVWIFWLRILDHSQDVPFILKNFRSGQPKRPYHLQCNRNSRIFFFFFVNGKHSLSPLLLISFNPLS